MINASRIPAEGRSLRHGLPGATKEVLGLYFKKSDSLLSWPMPTPGALFGMILFGAIGFAAFLYGKRTISLKPMILGVLLMAYPYFVSRPLWMYGIGAVLTLALFFPRG
jgi:hypothetical protein